MPAPIMAGCDRPCTSPTGVQALLPTTASCPAFLPPAPPPHLCAGLIVCWHRPANQPGHRLPLTLCPCPHPHPPPAAPPHLCSGLLLRGHQPAGHRLPCAQGAAGGQGCHPQELGGGGDCPRQGRRGESCARGRGRRGRDGWGGTEVCNRNGGCDNDKRKQAAFVISGECDVRAGAGAGAAALAWGPLPFRTRVTKCPPMRPCPRLRLWRRARSG